jgi:hypothetical protein
MQTGAPCNSQGPERVCTGSQPKKDGGSAIACARCGTGVTDPADVGADARPRQGHPGRVVDLWYLIFRSRTWTA